MGCGYCRDHRCYCCNHDWMASNYFFLGSAFFGAFFGSGFIASIFRNTSSPALRSSVLGAFAMARPRGGLFKRLPKSYLPLIGDAIIAWAEYEAELNAFVGLSQKDPDSVIYRKMIEAPYKRKLEIFKDAFKDRYPAGSYNKLGGILGQIKPLKDQRDALAHGTGWRVPYGQKDALVSIWRWYTDRHGFELEAFSKQKLVNLAAGIRREHDKLRKLMGRDVSFHVSRGRKPRTQP